MPAVLEANLTTLAPPGNPADFVCFDRVVWKEHKTREGRDEKGELVTPSVYLGRDELEQVAKNCNNRILDTGDFAVLCITHTSDDHAHEPEVIGFAGPFRVARVGNLKPKWVIVAKWWVYKSDAHKLKKYPRCSVEYWSDEDDPANGYFDPISLLGATTPELDLGIKYERDSAGRRLLRYQKVQKFETECAPGGSNTFIPGTVGGKRKQQYQMEGQNMALTGEDIAQLVEAFTPVIRAVVQEEMAGLNNEQEPLIDPNAIPQEPVIDDAMAGDPAAPPGDAMPGDAPPAGGDMPPEPVDAEQTDEDDEEEPEKFEARPDAASESLDAPEAAADAVADTAAKMKQKYQRQVDEYARKYQKEVSAHRETRQAYEKLKVRVDAAEREKTRAERYSKLVALQTDGYALDPDEELKECDSFTDEQFNKHCDRIVNRYSKAPVGRTLPMEKPEKLLAEAEKRQRVEQYAKQAASNVAKARQEGRKINYDHELNRLIRENEKTPVSA